MISILNPSEFIKALELSHSSGEKAFNQFINFLKINTENDSELTFRHEIGGSEKFLGWDKKNIFGGLLFDDNTKTWSSHT